MKVLLYAGPAPWRDLVLTYSAQFVEKIATALTLVTCGGREEQALLEETLQRFTIPAHVPVTLRALPGNAQAAILDAAQETSYDLVIFGRLNRPLGRLLPGPRSKVIAQRVQHSVLRVHGIVRPIQRILLASSGNSQAFDQARLVAQIAAPLGATVTIVHVLSQQSLFFQGFAEERVVVEQFLDSDLPEARVLRGAAELLNNLGVPATVKGRTGPVVDEVLAEVYTGGHDLLVIGEKRFDNPLDRILIEDMTSHIIDDSPLPVLVARDE